MHMHPFAVGIPRHDAGLREVSSLYTALRLVFTPQRVVDVVTVQYSRMRYRDSSLCDAQF